MGPHRSNRWLLLALLTLLVACPPGDDDDSTSDDDDSAADDDDATELPDRDVTLDGSCELDVFAGRFRAERQELFPVVDGNMANGVVPVTILEQIEQIGDCVLLRRNIPSCVPACEPGFTCDFGGECIDFPTNQDVGVVTFRGLSGPVAMTPVAPGNHYFDTSVGDPLFEAGDKILLDAAGGDMEPFMLEGVGSEVLELPEDMTIVVEEGEPILVEWPAPTVATDATVQLTLSIDQHGNSPVKVECEWSDTGSAAIPSEMTDALLGAGVSGYPNATLHRRTVDSAWVGDLCVELRVGSPRQPDVRVAGHTPCDDDEDCPDGLTCDEAINTCI
jgi:hypothetical protein